MTAYREGPQGPSLYDIVMAEDVGFEPTEPLGSAVFKTAAL